MFEIGASEILLIAIVALIAIGPQDLPDILFRLGRLVRRFRMMTNGLRDQYSEIMHEAELNHYRKQFGAKLMDEQEINEDLAFRTDAPPPEFVEHEAITQKPDAVSHDVKSDTQDVKKQAAEKQDEGNHDRT